jgi:alpha-galactosidase
MGTLRFPGFQIECDAISGMTDESSSHTLVGRTVTLAVPENPVEYYRHGWQSWSLTCWHGIDAVVPVLRPSILHPMHADPLNARRTDPIGSWLGAVRFMGGTVLLLGTLGTDARVEYSDGALRGRSDVLDDSLAWYVGCGEEEAVFASYAHALGERLGTPPARPAPRVWCSWYSFYTAIAEESVSAILPELNHFPVDVIQIDDGWQIAVGDWRANAKFPSGMAELAAMIRSNGRTAGLWLAPLIVVASSHVARDHRDWLLHDERGRLVSAGFNWGEQLYALDTTHPEAMAWVASVIRKARQWGFDYLKVDFLYGGALPGARRANTPREAAYRNALRVIREAAGDAYLVTCGAPIIPSLGHCDAIRVGPDVAGFWTSNRDEHLLCNPAIPGARNAIRTTLHRLWLKPIVTVDPDVVYLADRWNTLSADEKRIILAIAQICGSLGTSDLPSWIDARQSAEQTIESAFTAFPVTRRGPYSFEIGGNRFDFAPALGLPGPRNTIDRIVGAVVGWLANRRPVMRLNHSLGRREATRRLRSIMRRP